MSRGCPPGRPVDRAGRAQLRGLASRACLGGCASPTARTGSAATPMTPPRRRHPAIRKRRTASCAGGPTARAGERDPAPRDRLLRPRRPPKMMYPLVLDLADDGVPVAVTCRVLGFSKQAFYKWRAKPVSDRDCDDAHLINAAVEIHHDDPEFGYRFITDELAAQGWTASPQPGQPALHDPAAVVGPPAQTRSPAPARAARARRPRRREFTAQQPDQLWLTDITEHATAEGKLYCCPTSGSQGRLLQADRRLLHRQPHDLRARLSTALRNAVALRDPAATAIVHPTAAASSDPTPTSAPCTTRSYAARWDESGPARTTPPWSRSSACCRRTSSTADAGTRDELRLAIITWIETTYHRRRRQGTLGRLTPIEFETLLNTAHAVWPHLSNPGQPKSGRSPIQWGRLYVRSAGLWTT